MESRYFVIDQRAFRITHILKENHHRRKAGMAVHYLGQKQVGEKKLAIVCSEKIDFGTTSHEFLVEMEKLLKVG